MFALSSKVFRDVNTADPFEEDFAKLGDDGEQGKAAKLDHIYMDTVGFGMGCCCLQVTIQAANLAEARTLYDQLAVLCPILLALTAATPLFRGHIADTDCRWNVMTAAADCRTREERGLEPLTNNKYLIHKPRYDSVAFFVSEEGDRFEFICK